MIVKVVHVNSPEWARAKADGSAVYIGRACPRASDPLFRTDSPWANPFKTGGGISRTLAIRLYREWLLGLLPGYGFYVGRFQRPDLRRLGELRGKTLGCWCAPKECHGDALAEIIEGLERRP